MNNSKETEICIGKVNQCRKGFKWLCCQRQCQPLPWRCEVQDHYLATALLPKDDQWTAARILYVNRNCHICLTAISLDKLDWALHLALHRTLWDSWNKALSRAHRSSHLSGMLFSAFLQPLSDLWIAAQTFLLSSHPWQSSTNELSGHSHTICAFAS